MSRLYTLPARRTSRPVAPALPAEALALAESALSWALFASSRAPRHMHYYYRKALHAVRFSLASGAPSLALPSKLVGVAACQPAVCVLAAQAAAEGGAPVPLSLCLEKQPGGPGTLAVAFAPQGGRTYRLGRIQERHVAWLAPLLPYGAQVVALDVSGLGREGVTLGVNIGILGVGAALERYKQPRGAYPGGDGAPILVAEASLPYHSDSPEVTTPAGVVVFGRDERGAVVRLGAAAQTFTADADGVEFGYRGAGPHRLAVLLLTAMGLSAENAALLRSAFVEEVLASLPRDQVTVVPVADLVQWAANHLRGRMAA